MKKLLALLSIVMLGAVVDVAADYSYNTEYYGEGECATCPKKRCRTCPKRYRRCNRCPRQKSCATCPRSGETEQMEGYESDIAADRRSTVID